MAVLHIIIVAIIISVFSYIFLAILFKEEEDEDPTGRIILCILSGILSSIFLWLSN